MNQQLIDFYNKNGFLKCPDVLLTPEEFQKLSHYVLKTSEQLFPDKSGYSRNVWKDEPELIEFACNDAVINFMKPFLGPNIGVFTAYIFKKKAHSPLEVPLHSDVSNYDLQDDNFRALSVTIAVTECSKKSGCVEYAPGSHLKRQWNHHLDLHPKNSLFGERHLELTQDEAKLLSTPQAMELKPGEVSIADIAIVHRSGANRSDEDRVTLVFRYFSTSKTDDVSESTRNFLKSYKFTFLVAGKDQLELCHHKLVV